MLLYVYFFLATFLCQIVFFNVLIAVLSEEYSTRWANREAYALQEQTHIFSDYIWLLKYELPSKPYFYVVEPAT